jgi:NTP pyrophosphatase (non-canonical NTP hydrolase)
MSDPTNYYAVAATLLKDIPTGQNINTALYVVTARSEDEARGIAIRKMKESLPDHSLFHSVIVPIVEVQPSRRATMTRDDQLFDAVRPFLDAMASHKEVRAALASLPSAEGEYRSLRAANIARQAAWCPDQVPDLSFRGTELAGEVGEACNVIKKLERERLGWRGSRDTIEHLGEELADVVICADLVALSAGIDLSAAVVAKFNATSEKVGLHHRLAASPSAPTPHADHPDDLAVDRFAVAMKKKLALARANGRSGWDDPTQCSAEDLSRMLREHVEKGDPRDVANFCMMLDQRSEVISSAHVPTKDREIELLRAENLNLQDRMNEFVGPITDEERLEVIRLRTSYTSLLAQFEWACGLVTDMTGRDPRLPERDGDTAPAPRTDSEIVAQTNDVARIILRYIGTGYEVPSDHLFYEATDARSQKAWRAACQIMEHMTQTDAEDALSGLDAPTPTREAEQTSNALDAIVKESDDYYDAWLNGVMVKQGLPPLKSTREAVLEEAARANHTLIESLQEGLMTDAGLSDADRVGMNHQIVALEEAAASIRALAARQTEGE